MSIQPVEIQPSDEPVPDPAAKIIADAWETVQSFLDRTRQDPVRGFHPSDFKEAYCWLRALRSHCANPTPRMCEWGSGIAVIGCLAELIGFEVTAIECDPVLFAASEKWCTQIAAKIESRLGSFMPAEFVSDFRSSQQTRQLPHEVEPDSMWLSWNAPPVLAAEEIAEFDLIYAYPWPGEERVIFDLYDQFAATNSRLLTFHGAADFRIHRKL